MDNPTLGVRDAEVPGSNPGSPTTEVQVSRGSGPRRACQGFNALKAPMGTSTFPLGRSLSDDTRFFRALVLSLNCAVPMTSP